MTHDRPKRDALVWSSVGVALLALMLGLPLLLFAWISHVKLGFVSWSYYLPYEELFAAFASGSLHKIYDAPLAAVNVTSGFVIANMYTYTLGHTLATAVLGVLLVLFARSYSAVRSGARGTGATFGGTTASVCAITAASSSTALAGCCGAGIGGGMIALAGFGTITGAWLNHVATWAQLALIVLFGALLWRMRGARRAPSDAEPAASAVSLAHGGKALTPQPRT
jgi:hypothetical protein